MKKQIILLLIAVLAMNISIVAQNEQKQGKAPMTSKARAEQMATNLNLTADQTLKVEALFDEQQAKMKELKATPVSDQDARREEMKTMRKAWEGKLEGIIGKDNMAKNKAIMAEKAKAAKEKKAAE